MELSQALQKEEGLNGISAANSGLHVQNNMLVDQNHWANEVRKADERCVEYQSILTEL